MANLPPEPGALRALQGCHRARAARAWGPRRGFQGSADRLHTASAHPWKYRWHPNPFFSSLLDLPPAQQGGEEQEEVASAHAVVLLSQRDTRPGRDGVGGRECSCRALEVSSKQARDRLGSLGCVYRSSASSKLRTKRAQGGPGWRQDCRFQGLSAFFAQCSRSRPKWSQPRHRPPGLPPAAGRSTARSPAATRRPASIDTQFPTDH